MVMGDIQFYLIEKTKIGHPEHSLTTPTPPRPSPPPLPTSDNISFLPYPAPALIPPHPLLQSGRHTFNRSPKFKHIEKMFGLKGLEINSLSPKP